MTITNKKSGHISTPDSFWCPPQYPTGAMDGNACENACRSTAREVRFYCFSMLDLWIPLKFQAVEYVYSTFQSPSFPVPPYPIPTYLIPYYPIPSYPIQSFPIQSYPDQSYPVPFYPVFPTPSYPIPSYPIRSYPFHFSQDLNNPVSNSFWCPPQYPTGAMDGNAYENVCGSTAREVRFYWFPCLLYEFHCRIRQLNMNILHSKVNPSLSYPTLLQSRTTQSWTTQHVKSTQMR